MSDDNLDLKQELYSQLEDVIDRWQKEILSYQVYDELTKDKEE